MMGKSKNMKGYGKTGGKPGTGVAVTPQVPAMPRGYKSGGMVKPKGKK
jgi:hypothetical protein